MLSSSAPCSLLLDWSPQVKRLLVEIYAATTRSFAASMLKAVRAARIPIVHINVDLWASKSSGEKYIGQFPLVILPLPFAVAFAVAFEFECAFACCAFGCAFDFAFIPSALTLPWTLCFAFWLFLGLFVSAFASAFCLCTLCLLSLPFLLRLPLPFAFLSFAVSFLFCLCFCDDLGGMLR